MHAEPLSPEPTPERRTGSTRVLRRVLLSTRAHYHAGSAPTLGHLLRPLGGDASALAVALLALPFLSPVSLGPITTAASLLIALLGFRLLGSGGGVPLPERLLRLPVPRAVHRTMGLVLRRVHRWVLRLSRPRAPRLVEGRRGRVLCAVGILTGAALLAVPIPLLPLTNTFPAAAILLFALGWTERDGLLTLLAVAALLLSTAVFAALGAAVALLGWEAVQGLLPWVGRS